MNKDNETNIETERLMLRKLKVEDAEEIFKNWTSDGDVSKYTTWETHKSVEDTIKWLSEVVNNNNSTKFDWKIILKETGEIIGSIGAYLRENDENRYEPGYCLSKKYWRNGYTTEALRGVLDFLINKKGIKKFVCQHAKDNPASGRVLQKAGFKYIKDSFFENIDKTKRFESKKYYLDIE